MKLIKVLLESSNSEHYIKVESTELTEALGILEQAFEGSKVRFELNDPDTIYIYNADLGDINDAVEELQQNGIIIDETSIDNELYEGEDFSALAAAIEKELQDEKPVKEAAGILGILSYILLSNTIAHMISSMAKKIAKKQGWSATEDIATKIYDWTHKNEQAFMSPIKRVLSVVMVGPTKKYIEPVTKGLYAIFIFFLAGQYGGAALDAVKNSKWGSTAFNTVKSLVKGKEVHTLIRGVLSDVGVLG